MLITITIAIAIFAIINFVILFTTSTRTSRIIAIISSHLSVIFIFDIYLSSFVNFKEIVIAICLYSIVTLFLISNNKSFLADLADDHDIKYDLFKFYLPFATIAIAISICLVLIIGSTAKINKIIQEKKISRISELAVNPLILPSHPAHIAVKKFYLGKKFNDNIPDSALIAQEKNENQRLKNKDLITNNILLKRNSDIILIFAAAITSLLILANKKQLE